MKTHTIAIIVSVILAMFIACSKPTVNRETAEKEINKVVNNWHIAAAKADTSFFDYFTDDAIYIGTDATERWTANEFKSFAMPFFKRGKAWDFKPIERHVYLSEDGKLAYFDEKLNTWMGVCRSTGVMSKTKTNKWKIKYYHLSMTIPNEKVRNVLEVLQEQPIQDKK